MFSNGFEKTANWVGALGKSLAAGAKQGTWNPLKATPKFKQWGSVKGFGHNVGMLAKQYGPSALGAGVAGKMIFGGGNNQTINNNIRTQ